MYKFTTEIVNITNVLTSFLPETNDLEEILSLAMMLHLRYRSTLIRDRTRISGFRFCVGQTMYLIA